MKSILRCFAIILLAVSCSGCASVLTQMGPLKSELKDGDTSTGEFDRYEYSAEAEKDVIYLEKTPMCEEKREKIRVMKKMPRGLLIMLLEIPVYGLGLIDMMYTYSIIEHSRKEVALAEYETGNLVECGKKEPAEGETLFIKNFGGDINEKAVTDENGAVDLQEVMPGDLSGYITLRISLEVDSPSSFYYTYHAD